MLTPARKHLRTLSSVLLLALGCNGLPDASPSEDLTQEADQRLASPIHTSTVLFDGGTDGFHSFRIPSIIRTNAGTLLAFAEGRKNNDDDFGDINLV
jgi:sialidase-1